MTTIKKNILKRNYIEDLWNWANLEISISFLYIWKFSSFFSTKYTRQSSFKCVLAQFWPNNSCLILSSAFLKGSLAWNCCNNWTRNFIYLSVERLENSAARKIGRLHFASCPFFSTLLLFFFWWYLIPHC